MFGNFAKPVIKATKKFDGMAAVAKALQAVESQNVMLGIPAATNPRKDEPINNAQLGYILAHGVDERATATDAYLTERGDPLRRIPPRPFLDPAIVANQEIIAKQQANVIKAALSGGLNVDAAVVRTGSNASAEVIKLGLLGQALIKNWFTDPRNGWAPNAPSTIKKKGSDKPMIDTSALRNSITYVVRQNDKRR